MDPVTIGALLAAVAGGAGGAFGSQAWEEVTALVRRAFRNRSTSDSPSGGNGQAELAALARDPADEGLAVSLAEVLIARARADSEFARELAAWWKQAREISAEPNVANTVSGGTQHGPVLQGRDFTGLVFGSPAAPSPPDAPGKAHLS
jgi:hypothetical protein